MILFLTIKKYISPKQGKKLSKKVTNKSSYILITLFKKTKIYIQGQKIWYVSGEFLAFKYAENLLIIWVSNFQHIFFGSF